MFIGFRQGLLCSLCSLWLAWPALADEPQVIQNPGGGTLIYGVGPQSTDEEAIASTLRGVYRKFGDKPKLGKLFRSKREKTLSAFFEVTDAKRGVPYLGLIIVGPTQGGERTAVLFDEAKRFPTTERQMLQTLFGGPKSTATSSAPSRQVPPLTPAQFPDGSAQIGLPPGWRIVKSNLGQGVMEGPAGEMVTTSIVYTLVDPRSSSARYNPQWARAAWGTDLVRAWLAALPLRCRELGKAPFSVEVSNATPEGQSTRVEGFMDRHDGRGIRAFRTWIWGYNGGGGETWLLQETGMYLPRAIASQAGPTAMAVMKSYHVNQQVVDAGHNAQTQQQLQMMNARFANQQAGWRAQQAANEQHNAGYWIQQDSNARNSQGFSNYIREQTVVTDSKGRHGTFSNAAADLLIKACPNDFQAVPTSQYLRNIDFNH